MDQENPLIKSTRESLIVDYLHLWMWTTLFWYYATTYHEEVSTIWPQSFRKLGKILFLIARYSQIPQVIIWCSWFLPSRGPWSLSGCLVLFRLGLVLETLSINCAEAIFWICLFALLEGRRRYFALLVFVWLGFFVPIQTLQWMSFATYFAIEPTPFDRERGYSCRYSFTPGPNTAKYELVTLYMAFTRTILFVIAALVTLFVRYKRQNALLRVIKREGGMYYLSAALVLFFASLIRTPGFPVKNPYISRSVIKVIRNVAQYICAERLLFQMQKVVAFSGNSRTLVSTLVFDVEHVPTDPGKASKKSTDDTIRLEERRWRGAAP